VGFEKVSVDTGIQFTEIACKHPNVFTACPE